MLLSMTLRAPTNFLSSSASPANSRTYGSRRSVASLETRVEHMHKAFQTLIDRSIDEVDQDICAFISGPNGFCPNHLGSLTFLAVLRNEPLETQTEGPAPPCAKLHRARDSNIGSLSKPLARLAVSLGDTNATQSVPTPAPITPYPTGRLSWGGGFPGTSCQASIAPSLRDFSQLAPELLYSRLLPLKRGCRIGKRRLCINCNTGDPGLEDVVGPESVWESLHRLRLFLIGQDTLVTCPWDSRNWCSPSEVLERSRRLR
jgi:hypothetical protein